MINRSLKNERKIFEIYTILMYVFFHRFDELVLAFNTKPLINKIKKKKKNT